MRSNRRKSGFESGFTLTELMVVIAIIAILAAVAVPLFTRDTAESKYNELLHGFTQEVQRAKLEAISSREDRALLFNGTTNYQLVAMTPGETSSGNYALLRATTVPPNMEITGFALGSTSHTPGAVFPTEIRYTAVSDIEVRGNGLGDCGSVDCDSAFCQCSITIFFRSKDDRYKHRYVIYRGTGYAERFEGW